MDLERSLGIFAADEPDSRIELVQVSRPGEAPTLEFRLQRQCADLGWCTHRRMRMAAGQIPDVHAALNMMDPDARQATIRATDKASARAIRLVKGNHSHRYSG